MNYKKQLKPKKDLIYEELQEFEENRLIEMAWQDRITFDVIKKQYGLTENQLKNKMRKLISKKAYGRWRKRVQGRVTKHKRNFKSINLRFQGPW